MRDTLLRGSKQNKGVTQLNRVEVVKVSLDLTGKILILIKED